MSEIDLQPFPFEGPDGETYELPDVRVLTPRQFQAAAKGDLDALETAIRTNGSDEAADAFMDLPFWRVNTLLDEWMHAAGKAPSSSSPSSNSTARPSKRTSRSGGSRSKR